MPKNVGAAILSKIERVFLPSAVEREAQAGQADPFVCFHMPAIPYDPGFLRLVNRTDADRAAESFAQQFSFAQLMNLVPAVSALFGTPSTLTWDVYQVLLDTAILARSTLTTQERSDLAEANALLYRPDGDPSEQYTSYVEAQRRWQAADEEVRSLQLGIEASDDRHYRSNLEEQLELALQDRESTLEAWVVEGRKGEVEQALALKIRLEGRGVQDAWRDREDRFEAARRDDPEFGAYWRTGFEPRAVVDSDAWSSIAIDKSEISGLVERARPAVQTAAEGWAPDDGSNRADVIIERITFKAARIDILRPWFDAGVFESRAWKLPSHTGPVSDGTLNPRGLLPAYVVSAIMVKDVDIRLQPERTKNAEFVRSVAAGRLGLIGPFAVRNTRRSTDANPLVAVRAFDFLGMTGRGRDGESRLRTAVEHRVLSNAAIAAVTGGTRAAAVHRPGPAPAARRGRGSLPFSPAAAARPSVPPLRRPRPHSVVGTPVVSRTKPPNVPSEPIRARLAPTTASTSAPEDPRRDADDDVPTVLHVVAYICARTPRSPNPDPSLDWGSS